MGDDLSLADRKQISILLEQKKEESKWSGWVDSKEAGKKEKRILLISTNKIFFLKQGGKIAREHHYLDLEVLHSNDKNEVTLTLKGTPVGVISDATDDIIDVIRNACGQSFPGIPEKDRFKLEVTPENRLREVSIVEQPLGGFIATYKSMCVYYGTEIQQEVVDMEQFYLSGNIRNFNLREYEQPISPNDFKPLLGALQYNNFFKSLIIKDIPLDKTMIDAVARVLKFNTKIEEIYLSKVGLKAEGMKEICDSLTFNKGLLLTTFDLSENSLEDKGIGYFASWLGGLNRGLAKIDLSDCAITSKGFRDSLGPALKRNVHMGNTLTYFSLANNKLEADGSQQLANFLANPNSIRYLNLSNSSANFDVIVAAILRGSTEIRDLNLSGNKLAKKDSLVRLLQSANQLTQINLSNLQPTPDMARDILNAISANPYLKEVSVNLSENKLGLEGARFIQSIADKLSNITSLDLSENDFGDEGVQYIFDGFAYNQTLKHLAVDRNFKGKFKNIKSCLDAIIHLLNGSDCPLESLSIAGGKGSELKTSIKAVISALSSNVTLKSLDISGNEMGNTGATALSRTLQMNQTLETLKWDNNLISYQGYEVFASGLRRNKTLKNVPVPVFDISSAKSDPRTIKIIEKIESLLIRNQNPQAKIQNEEGEFEGGSSNQFAFLASGQRELLQKALLKIKSTGKKVEAQNQVIVEDAENTDQYMTNLFNLKDEIYSKLENDMKGKLTSNAQTIIPIYGAIKAELLKSVDVKIKQSFKCLDEDTVKRLQTVLAFGAKDLEQEEVERILIESAGASLVAKANQALHNLVSLASDYIYEKVGDQLNDVADELLEDEEAKLTRTGSIVMEKEEPKEALTKSQVAPGQDKKPPSKPAPKPPSQASKPVETTGKPPSKPAPKPPVNRAAKPTTSKTDDENLLKDLPQVTTTLTEHATKARAGGASGRKPPTRKARNAQTPSQM